MRSEWKKCKLGEICHIKGGKRLPKGTNLITKKNLHPYIRIKNLGQEKTLELNSSYEYVEEKTQKSISKYIVNSGDIVLSIVGSIGLVGIIGRSLNNANLTENCVKLANLKEINSDFLYYYLISSKGQNEIAKGTVGAVQPKLPIKNIQNIDLDIPPLPVQKKIAGVLKSLDDKIELNRQISKNLEEQAWCLFDKTFPDSHKGKNKISDYILPQKGNSLQSKDAVPGSVPVVAGGLNPATYHNVANTSAPVITISASGANAGYVNLWNIPVWSSDSSYIDNSITASVYFWYILLKKRQNEIFDAQTGSAQPHIYPSHIGNMPMCSVSQEKMEKFHIQVTPLFELVGKNILENQKLSSLRDTLLPKLMNGEIEV